MVALVTSILILLAGVGVCLLVARRRPVGTPLTWGEAILGSTFVFAMLLVGYGVVPNAWLQLEQNEWKWRADATAYVLKFWGRGQILITKQAVGDVVVTMIYVIMLTLNILLWSQWQKRGQRRERPAIVESSAFGRPLRKV